MYPALLEDKVVIITGGAGVLGKEFASSVVRHGGIAVIADVDRSATEAAQREIALHTSSGRVECLEFDITSTESIDAAIDIIDKKYHRIDALVNNAYPRNDRYGRSFFNVEYLDFCENMNMHLGGYFLASKQAAKYFLRQKHGHIINIASVYGVIPPRFEIYEETAMTMPVEYAVIKSGIIHLTKYLAKYLKGSSIRVNAISPGGITAQQPDIFLRRYNELCLSKGMLDKGDINGTLIFLLSDMSEYINGQNLIVDDGFSL